MANDDFYAHDRPKNPQLPEDRPRGGGPEDPSPRTGSRRKSIWLIVGIIVLVVIFLALFMP
ncbi:hypothetical protein [Streptomyces solaniscabiei]|jgi:hypothetical protein|uniref:hypothetical protein n=1 Tax=Streptomyces solaniscabiei TaxID=2683255 RepID=UPI001CE303E9|nr:hypothetical protein [Streptomyces solaniscabiei]